MNIGNLIHAERKAKGKTLREIADALAISPNRKTGPLALAGEIITLQNRGDGHRVLVQGCVILWRKRLGHDVEGGHQRRDADLFIQVDLEVRRVTGGLQLGVFGGDEL